MRIIYENSIQKAMLKLESSSRAKTDGIITLLERFGHELRMPYCKKIGPNLFELRVKGKEEIRIFYTIRDNEAILIHMFKKKSKKIPPKELHLAQKKLKRLEKI